MRRKLTITFLTSLLLLSCWQFSTSVSAQQELTLAAILTGLQTKGKTPETATLPARNVYITKRVQTYGVTFRLTPDIEQELRNAGASQALINAIRANGPSTPTPTPSSSKPSAEFKKVWVDYDVNEGGQDGMRIHLSFTTYRMKNLDSYVAVYFMDQNENKLRDKNRKFYSTSGDVAAYLDIKPGYDTAEYEDYSIFMPYEELDLGAGKYTLKMDIDLIYKNGGLIQHLTFKDFEYSNTPKRNPDSVTSKVNRVWVDYNVTESGRRGMRVHVNFEVTGLKEIDAMLTARIQKENGDVLLSTNNSYSNDEGELQIKYDIKPGYDTTVFKDAALFLPYDEIKINRGKWNLKLDIDLNYEDGSLIKHLDFYEFEFERP